MFRTTCIVAFYEIFISAMRGMNDVVIPMVLNILGLCGVLILWIQVIMPVLFESAGLCDIIISCPVSWVFTAVTVTVYYMVRRKKRIENIR